MYYRNYSKNVQHYVQHSILIVLSSVVIFRKPLVQLPWGDQLSWESNGLTSRRSQVRTLYRPPFPPDTGVVVQLVRTPACHAGGRRFKSGRPRHLSWHIDKGFLRKTLAFRYITSSEIADKFRVRSSVGERLPHMQEFGSSILSAPTMLAAQVSKELSYSYP